MKNLIYSLALVGFNTWAAADICTTKQVELERHRTYVAEWNYKSVKVTVADADVTLSDGTFLQLPRVHQTLELQKSNTNGKGVLINLVGTKFPGNKETMGISQANVKVVPGSESVVTFSDGSTCPMDVIENQINFSDCGVPNTLTYFVSPTGPWPKLKRDYQMINAMYDPLEIFVYNTKVSETTTCCTEGESDPQKCTSSAPVVKALRKCELRYHCLQITRIQGG